MKPAELTSLPVKVTAAWSRSSGHQIGATFHQVHCGDARELVAGLRTETSALREACCVVKIRKRLHACACSHIPAEEFLAFCETPLANAAVGYHMVCMLRAALYGMLCGMHAVWQR